MNCLTACKVAAEEGLTIAASDLGGTRGRRIHFHTGTGEVLLHRLPAWQAQNDGAAARKSRNSYEPAKDPRPDR